MINVYLVLVHYISIHRILLALLHVIQTNTLLVLYVIYVIIHVKLVLEVQDQIV